MGPALPTFFQGHGVSYIAEPAALKPRFDHVIGTLHRVSHPGRPRAR
jgi:hypothetical protein